MLRYLTLPNIASIMTLVFSGFMFYLMFFPVRVLEIYNTPLPTSQSVYEPGQTISYGVEFCRYQEGATAILRKLVYDDTEAHTSQSFTQLTTTTKASRSCPESEVDVSTQIPEDAPCGMAHLELRYIDRATLLQIKELAVETQPFQICSAGREGAQ